jgi:ABC-type transporter Mla subunit MlaD
MRLDVHFHNEDGRVLQLLEKIMGNLDALTAQVTANTTVIGSALTLINGFAAQLAAAGTDPAKLADLANQLKTQDDALAAAVAANTIAAPTA